MILNLGFKVIRLAVVLRKVLGNTPYFANSIGILRTTDRPELPRLDNHF